jgi:predicted aspartyl protease
MGWLAAFLIFIVNFLVGPLSALHAEDGPAIWKQCQSSDADKRLIACTAIINAKGFGSPARLADALDARCWAYNAKMEFDRAIIDCKNSIALRPSYFYAYNNLGTAYLGMNNYEEAITVLDQAIALRQNFSWSHINRARAYAGLGRNDDAIRDYQYVLTMDPHNEEVRQALRTLKAGQSSLSPLPKPSVISSIPPGSPKLVALQNDGGTYVVPVVINNVITLKFVVDSGASHVSIPADVVSTLLRTGTIDRTDFIGQQTYVLADGTEVPSVTFRLRSLRIGDIVITNVVAGLAPAKGSLLLGQSFLGRFKSWSIDNTKHALFLNE